MTKQEEREKALAVVCVMADAFSGEHAMSMSLGQRPKVQAALDLLTDCVPVPRAELDRLRGFEKALREIEEFIDDEYHRGEKPYQAVIIARKALEGK